MIEVYNIAKKYIGLKEIAGAKHNPQIVKFFKMVTGHEEPDETSWCAIFCGACLIEAGLKSTGKMNAKSYLTWGKSSLANKGMGDVCIFWRESPESWKGHVGFYAGEDKDNIFVLGGNQNNQVSIAKYPKSRLLDIRTRSS